MPNLQFSSPTLAARLRQLLALQDKVLDALQAPAALLARLYVAQAFFASGLTKLRDWDTTLALFMDEYMVPVLPTGVAAVMGTTGELVLPVLLVVNVIAVVSLSEIAPAALQQHLTWGVTLVALAVYGPGKWSVDTIFLRWLQQRD